MPRPDEGLIHAWLDGELAPAEAARVERLAETDAEWRSAVAEARGFIAASSRIVGALDAVPGGVLPAGDRAALPTKGSLAVRAFRVRPWMGVAAGLAFVAGTVYVMRETPEAAFGPRVDATVPAGGEAVAPAPITPAPATSAPVTPAPVTTGSASGRRPPTAGPEEEDRAASGQPRDLPVAPAQAEPAPPAPTSPLGAAAAAPPAPVPSVTRQDAAAAPERASARERSEANRLGRAAVAEVADIAEKTASATILLGCWRVSAPDSLASLYRDLSIVRSTGDTLVLMLPGARTVVVVRTEDRLRGALTATREACPADP